VRTNVRLLVASNTVLAEEVRAGRFRADLFYRLHEFTLSLAPLRTRKEDIRFLAERFRREAAAELHKECHGFTQDAHEYLFHYDWPGNVRELRNVVRRAVLSSTRVIEVKHLRQHYPPTAALLPAAPPVSCQHLPPGRGLPEMVQKMTEQLEKSLIQQTLDETGGNKRLAARRLQIGYKTLFRKLQAYQLS
jgi:DNA-binding NtrC family response regulator